MVLFPKYINLHNHDPEIKNNMVDKVLSNYTSSITSFSDYRRIKRHDISTYNNASDCPWMLEYGTSQQSSQFSSATEATLG